MRSVQYRSTTRIPTNRSGTHLSAADLPLEAITICSLSFVAITLRSAAIATDITKVTTISTLKLFWVRYRVPLHLPLDTPRSCFPVPTLSHLHPRIRACSIRGQSFGLGTTEIGLNYRLRHGLPVPTVPALPRTAKRTPQVTFVDPEFNKVLANTSHPLHNAAREFYLHLALNHEVRQQTLCAQKFVPATTRDFPEISLVQQVHMDEYASDRASFIL